MRLRSSFAAVLLLLGAFFSASVYADEYAERAAIHAQVRKLMAADNYAGLDALANRYRNPAERTSSGAWKLGAYYEVMFNEYFSITQTDPVIWDKRLAWAKRWTAAHPDSPTAHVVLGRAILYRGLSYRGTSIAREVPKANWSPFQRYAAQALDYLLQHKKVAAKDPYYYSTLENVAHRNKWSIEDFMTVFDEGAARYPQYYPIFYVPVNTYFSPQWGGSPEALESFARHALTKVPVKDRPGLYARIYLESWQSTGQNPFYFKRVEWPLMSKGIDDILARYPSQYNAQVFAYQACMARDRDKTAALLKRVTSPPDMRIWGYEDYFKVCGDPDPRNWTAQ